MPSTDLALAQAVRAQLDSDIAEAERRYQQVLDRQRALFDDYNAALTRLANAGPLAAQRSAELECNRAKNRIIELIEPRIRAEDHLRALKRPDTYQARLDEARDRERGVVA